MLRASVVAALCAHAMHAQSQTAPAKPVRVVVPFGPGGGGSVQARLITDAMRQDSGRSFVIDNRPGAGGLIGAQIVADASPDGATVLFTTSTLAVNTTLFAETMRFDPRRDLTPVSLLSAGPLVLCVHPSVPAKSVRELIELARKHPGKLAAGINEFGSTGHLAAEMLNQLAGINTTIVPYKGGGPALMGLLTGDVALLFVVAPVAMSQLQAKRIRGLAVTTPQRSAAFAGLPALKEIVPGLETDVWYAVFFPRATPDAIVTRFNADMTKALGNEAVKTFYKREGLEAIGSPPNALRMHLAGEIAKYAKVIQQANIKAQ